MNRFAIHAPTSVAEAATLLETLDEAAAYAGGTELLLAMKEGFLRYEHLVDVKRIPELAELAVDHERAVLRIGANVTHRRLERDPEVAAAWPLLARVESQVGNVRVRNTGTIGGNLCFAEPHSDIAALCLLGDARIRLAGTGGERVLAAADFFVGPFETALAAGELLTELELPLPGSGAGVGYQRFATKERPVAICAASLRLDGAGRIGAAALVLAGATPVPTRAAVDALVDVTLDDLPEAAREVTAEAAAAADVISDQEGSEAYKRQLLSVLTRRALAEAAAALESA